VEGDQGDLLARRVQIFLESSDSKLEHLEAEDDVVSRVDTRTVRGTKLKYVAKDDSYEVRGTASKPVILQEVVKDGCQQLRGGQLNFTRGADTMSVDGQTKSLAESKKLPSCQ